METQTVGFVGLGRMGGPMSARLVAAGYRLIGLDAAGTQERLPKGAEAAASISDMAQRTGTIFLSLPDGPASLDVCRQIAQTDKALTHTVVDLSTIGIAAAQQCADVLESAGISYVDAPVSGGVAGATSGSLALMAGASAETWTEVEPMLAVLAKNRFRVGDTPGQGQAMKLLNNYVSAAALAATCEAAVFGARLGLDPTMMIEVLNVSSGRSAASEDKFPSSIVPGTYDYGFTGALMTKDVTLYLENAVDAGVPHDLASATTAVWQEFNAAHPEADFTYIHKHFEDQSKDPPSQE